MLKELQRSVWGKMRYYQKLMVIMTSTVKDSSTSSATESLMATRFNSDWASVEVHTKERFFKRTFHGYGVA